MTNLEPFGNTATSISARPLAGAKGTTYVSVNVAAPVTVTLPPAMPVGFVAAIANPGEGVVG